MIFFFFLFFFSWPNLNSRRLDVYPTSTRCGLSADLECRSETSCMRLTGKNRTQKIAKNSPSAHCVTTLSQQRHVSIISKNFLNSNISSTCPHIMVNFSPLTAEICWRVWGTPANFNRFRVLPLLLQRHRSPETNKTAHDVWPSPGMVHYVYIFGCSCLLKEFCAVQISLYVQVLHCPILAALLARQQRASAKFCGMVQGMELRKCRKGRHAAAYIWQGGHHVGHRPTC